jgi:ABC-type branched-subunit amino acid transport system substrate-binding protein
MANFLRAPSSGGSATDAGTGSTDAGGPHACGKAAVIHFADSSGVGTPVAQEFEARFQSKGGAISYDAVADPSATTYLPLVQQLAASNAECLVLLMLSNQGDLFLRELSAFTPTDTSRDWRAFTIMGSTSFYSSGFIANGRTDPTNATLPTAAEGLYGTAQNEAPQTQEYAALFKLYQTQFPDAGAGGPPLTSVYDAVMLVALAIEQAGSTDGKAIRDALFKVSSGTTQYGPLEYAEAVASIQRGESIHYLGASGSCAFDQNGDVLDDYIIWQVASGAFVTVAQVPSATLQ